MSLDREMFQITRVVEVVDRHRHECPQSIIEHLFRRAREFAGDVAPLDDMTAIVAKVKPNETNRPR